MRFWVGKADHDATAVPAEIPWECDPRGYFHRLLGLRSREAGLTKVGGVYVMWHRGLHPKWIYVGASGDLGASIDFARDEQVVLDFEALGNVYVTWAQIKPEFRDGVALYLRTSLDCEIDMVFPTDHVDTEAEPIPVLPPK